jgi:hypothetical protein
MRKAIILPVAFVAALAIGGTAYTAYAVTTGPKSVQAYGCVTSAGKFTGAIYDSSVACPKGTTEVTVTGKTGATGATGKTGPQGTAGKTGAIGATGSRGSQGPAGPAGPAGAKGDTGAAGPQGVPGPSTAGQSGLDSEIVITNETPTTGTPEGPWSATATCPSDHPYLISGGMLGANGSEMAAASVNEPVGQVVPQSSTGTHTIVTGPVPSAWTVQFPGFNVNQDLYGVGAYAICAE